MIIIDILPEILKNALNNNCSIFEFYLESSTFRVG